MTWPPLFLDRALAAQPHVGVMLVAVDDRDVLASRWHPSLDRKATSILAEATFAVADTLTSETAFGRVQRMVFYAAAGTLALARESTHHGFTAMAGARPEAEMDVSILLHVADDCLTRMVAALR
jgi:hypothetical protein